MNADLVCEGGGVRGIGLLGAIYYLNEQGYEFKRIAGNSAGAISAALIAAGYSGNELKELAYSINYKEFIDMTKLCKIPIIGPIMSITKSKGLFKGDALERFMEKTLLAKGKSKFKDIAINNISPLKIITADITRHELVVLPDDLIKYNIDPLEFSIAKAVRMSMSIPYVFTPVLLDYNNGQSSYMVDGGLINNFPVWLFDVDGIPRWPTFGLRLISDSDLKFTEAKDTSILGYLFDIIDTGLSSSEEAYLNNKDSIRTINIPTFDISSFNFNLTRHEVDKLFNSGYNSAKEFLNNWNFNNYITQYRI